MAPQHLFLHQRHLQHRGLLYHGLSLPTHLLDPVREEEQREEQLHRHVYRFLNPFCCCCCWRRRRRRRRCCCCCCCFYCPVICADFRGIGPTPFVPSSLSTATPRTHSSLRPCRQCKSPQEETSECWWVALRRRHCTAAESRRWCPVKSVLNIRRTPGSVPPTDDNVSRVTSVVSIEVCPYSTYAGHPIKSVCGEGGGNYTCRYTASVH